MAKTPDTSMDLFGESAPAASRAPAAAAGPAKPAANPAAYDESKIKTLSSLEHIRLRSGMYIGRLGDGGNPNDGIYVLLKEVVDNSVDEFIMGSGRRIDITLSGSRVTIRDFGRGIPLGKVVDCVSVINTGAKYNTEVFQFSVGLNGVGTKAVNALSKHFEVCSYREGKYSRASFTEGRILSQEQGDQAKLATVAWPVGSKEAPSALAKAPVTDANAATLAAKGRFPDGTIVVFDPDPGIFADFKFELEYIEERLWNYAYLNQGLILTLDANDGKGVRVFESKRGLFDLLEAEVGGHRPDGSSGEGREGEANVNTVLYDMGYYKGKQLEFAFTHTTSYGESYFSFVNGQNTSDGGTHLSAFREGFLKGVNEFYKKDFTGSDVRDGFAAAVAVKLENPIFESQTKNKLGNTDVRAWILNETREAVVDFLHKNPTANKKMLDKILQNESLRKELAVVKNKARENAKKIALKIPSLKDCKLHFGEAVKDPKTQEAINNTMIFLTEGQSASGSMVSCRDVMTQAIFSLRGKVQNMHGKKRAEIYQNEELYNLTMALGIENDLEGLRYAKVVLATDADNDGFHIRNLLLTFFLTYFEEMVVRGHIYILETPLFRVRNKAETIYCYSEKERDAAVLKLGGTKAARAAEARKAAAANEAAGGDAEAGSTAGGTGNAEVTRFKGLGEINPKEFGQFIGANIRLVPVDVKTIKGIGDTLEFYMGKNTPTRRDFIMQNLI